MTPPSARRARLGMFGGAFDPPHLAHVALARSAIAQLGLDELRVFPTGQAWHKARALTPAIHRLAMARLAFADVPGAVVDGRELQRQGPTYTVDTLRELRAEHPAVDLFLIIGADQAQALDSWRESAEIARLATISIAERASPQEPAGMLDASRVPGGRWERIELPPMPFSATEIRQRVAAGQGITHLVPEPVSRYIDQHHLYQPS